jgi:predicted nucleic acid-binding protein
MPTTPDSPPDSLIDTSAMIDLLDDSSRWFQWVRATIADAQEAGRTLIGPVVAAELAGGFPDVSELNARLAELEVEPAPMPWEAFFAADHAFSAYRRAGGPRNSLLPDFFIGAHAAFAGYRLITRAPRRIRQYFPNVEIVAPDAGQSNGSPPATDQG